MASEQRGFVFAVTFIVIFSVLLSTIPADLQGQGKTPDMVTPLDPSIITGFSEGEDYTRTDFDGLGVYTYTKAGRDWLCVTNQTAFEVSAKILIFGVLWLGAIDACEFITSDGIDRGQTLTLDEITTDAEDGIIQYLVKFTGTGGSAGGFVVYWNTTTYANPSDAWTGDELYLLHGFGIQETATADIGALLVSLLFLQLPDVPLLVNVLLVTPIWASIIYILWFIIKEMIPFL